MVLPKNLAEVQRFYQEGLRDRAGNRRRPQREWDVSGMDATMQEMLADYKIRVINLAQLEEENFKTGLRELVGMFKRRDSKQEMRKYFMENRERFKKMDEATYDVICAVLQLTSLEGKKDGGSRQGKEGIDMRKAFDDWAKEEQEKGRKEGRKEGEIRLEMLIDRLIGEGRTADARKAATDLQARRRLYQEYGIG